ncbi:MAG: hypothetical protein CVU39_10060 [Chloroflexi bacterium HGW-Chloroflexi-10]|nr:MAG: hypothetical protein CVU39_10060 [Chloroflexi bacterium HGW-Chloroflexi-10]
MLLILVKTDKKLFALTNALHKTAIALSSTLDFDQLLDLILQQISTVISFDSASISLREGDLFRLVALRDFKHPDKLLGVTFPIRISSEIVSPNITAIETGKSIRIGEIPLEYPHFFQPLEETILSWMCIPLFAKNIGIGSLNLDSHKKNHFTEEDEWIGELFASQVAIALENTRLYTELKRKATEQSFLNELLKIETSHDDVAIMLNSVDKKISEFFQSSICVVCLIDPNHTTWKTFYLSDSYKHLVGNSYPYQEGIPGLIIQGKKSCYLKNSDAFLSLAAESGRDFFGIIPTSLIGTPLVSPNEAIGALLIARLDQEKAFTEDEFSLFMLMGDQISVTLQNALLYQKIKHTAIFDELSGLYNRHHFFNEANQEFHRAKTEAGIFSVIMLDLDYFKSVNDTYGHIMGDKLLQKTAQLFQKNIRRLDTAARYGGEEFIALLPNTPIAEAALVAKRICTAIAEKDFVFSDQTIKITASLGVSTYSPGDTLKNTCERADQALLIAKQSGRNQVVIGEN